MLKIEKDNSYNKSYDVCSPSENGEFNLISNIEFQNLNPIIFDVGANKGSWAIKVSEHFSNARIHAFEPVLDTFNDLVENTNGINIKCNNLAILDKLGQTNFYYYGRKDAKHLSELSSIYKRSEEIERNFGLTKSILTVNTTTISSYCNENNIKNIDFLKIDTEGAEHNVINGAMDLIKSRLITYIQFEYGGTYLDSKNTLKNMYNILSEYYLIYKILPKSLLDTNQWDERLEDYKYANYIAILK